VKPFALLIDYVVIEFIGKLSRKEQAAIWSRMRLIRDHPYNNSDYSERDPIGRQIHINVSSKYALKYWIDEADRQIKVLDIIPSDRKK
jgi:hypothetical protein